jgi:hypothetical protein
MTGTLETVQHLSTPSPSCPLDGSPLVSAAPEPACEVVVAVPVRDEARSIRATLDSLAAQVDQSGTPIDPRTFEVILLANNCSDRTVEIACEFSSSRDSRLKLHVVDLSLNADAHVGHARRLAMDEACRRLIRIGKPRGIIATTDGDTRVSPVWVSATRSEIWKGVDAVGGRIKLDPADLQGEGERCHRYHLLDVGYRLLVAELEAYLDPVAHDPWPRHFQHFGASMAVTAAAYLRAGGLPARPFLEDVAFYDALVLSDARIRHSPDVQVTTSARRAGRTGFGFAAQLAHWELMDRDGIPLCVEPIVVTERRLAIRSALRRVWTARSCANPDTGAGELNWLAASSGMSSGWWQTRIDGCETLGELLSGADAELTCDDRSRVDIRQAIAGLRERLASLRHRAPVEI